MGIFSDWAIKYYEMELSVIPIDPATKKPSINDWNKYSDVLPTEAEVNFWIKIYPNANLGIVCGKASNLTGLDFDYTGPDSEKIEKLVLACIPSSPIRKKGHKGWTGLYQYSGIRSFSINRGKKRILDILSGGKQTVIPPSIHPITEEPYVWLTEDDLLNYSVKDLPMLPSDLETKLRQLEDIDLKSAESIFNERHGRHDTICAYAWAIIEKVDSLDELIKLMVEYDLKKHGDDPYFSDRKYFKRGSSADAARSIALRIEKTVISSKKKKGIEWKIGSWRENEADSEELFFPKDIEKISKKYESFKNGFSFIVVDKKGDDKTVPLYEEFSRYMFEVEGLRFYNKNYIYIHNGMFFEQINEMVLKNIISKRVFDGASVNFLNNYYKRCEIDCQVRGKLPERVAGLINLKNGVFNLNEKKLYPHSKKYFFTNFVSVDYNENAACPKWTDFLNDVFSNDSALIKSIQQMFGYILMGGYPFLHKAFVLIGSGRNGKGIVLSILKKILGKDSYSIVSLSMLDKPFSLVRLDGSLANISEESPASVNSEMFKNIVSGGEIQAANKGKDEYVFESKCRMVFACNDFPYFDDKNNSMNSRLLIIPFNKTYVEGENLDPYLYDKLVPEISGIFSWALTGAYDLINKPIIEVSKVSKDIKEEFREESDQVYAWFKECVAISPGQTTRASIQDIYLKYEVWSKYNGHVKLNKNNFSKRLKRLISEKTNNLYQPIIYKETGKTHRGYDCLVVITPKVESHWASNLDS